MAKEVDLLNIGCAAFYQESAKKSPWKDPSVGKNVSHEIIFKFGSNSFYFYKIIQNTTKIYAEAFCFRIVMYSLAYSCIHIFPPLEYCICK